MKKYSYLGVFRVDGRAFGFDGCFFRQGEADGYITYVFNFPKFDSHKSIRKVLMTVHLSTYYAVETIFDNKEFFSEEIWKDQALSFNIFNGGGLKNGYSIGGQIYPWFKKKLSLLNDEQFANLNKYVFLELKRISIYFFDKDLFCSQVTIKRESFFIQVNLDGRWLSWDLSRPMEEREEFSSHNIDFYSDQELCFAAIIATNTWLREN